MQTEFLMPKISHPKMIIAFICANWCKHSQYLENHFEDLKDRFSGQGILFIRIDGTNEATKAQPALLIKALDIDRVLRTCRKTGQMVLINNRYRRKQKLDALTSAQDFETMVTTIYNNL